MPPRPASRSRSTGASTASRSRRTPRPAARAARPRGLCRGERTAGVAHRPAGRASRRHPDRQAADLPGALARPGRCRRERAGGAAVDPMTATAMAAAIVPGSPPPRGTAAQPAAAHVKVMVAPVTGAPSDGNRQLYSGMRRALGSSKIVIVDAAGADVFTVVGNGEPDADRRTDGASSSSNGCSRTPPARNVGDLEQSNPVPLAAAKGSLGGLRRHRRDGGVRRRARTARKGDQSAALDRERARP